MQEFATKLGKEHLISDMIPLFSKLAQDEQDSVRLLTVTDLVAIAEQLTPEESKIYFLQPLKAMVADKSWRVRYMIADNFVKVMVRTRIKDIFEASLYERVWQSRVSDINPFLP